MPSRKLSQPVEELFGCQFCKRSFKRENSLAVHMCATKQRHLARDEQHVRMGFRVWIRFYEVNHARAKKTWDDFIRSQYYNDFIRVGRHILDINAVNLTQYVDFLVTSGIPITKWTQTTLYERYMRELNKKETPDAAVQRCLNLMQQWAGTSGEHWTDFFRKVTPGQATLWIKSGRLSPWVIYLSRSSEELLGRMSAEQMQIISAYIEPDFWQAKLTRHAEEVEFFADILDKAGV